ncbi:hypothetical protein ACOMHN_059620 [Nucella lapillus]
MGVYVSDDMIDQRNGLAEASPGDKCYQAPEYSKDFHHLGATCALTRYDGCYRQKEKRRMRREDVEDVLKLEQWRPATPLPLTIPCMDESG